MIKDNVVFYNTRLGTMIYVYQDRVSDIDMFYKTRLVTMICFTRQS